VGEGGWVVVTNQRAGHLCMAWHCLNKIVKNLGGHNFPIWNLETEQTLLMRLFSYFRPSTCNPKPKLDR
jgi:hypothetical protein